MYIYMTLYLVRTKIIFTQSLNLFSGINMPRLAEQSENHTFRNTGPNFYLELPPLSASPNTGMYE